jgi:hypothetical protein
MRRPFIPNRDSDFDRWLANFAAKIVADPASYGLSPGDAAEIDAARAAWHAAFLVARAPATRTLPSIADKDGKRAAAVVVARRLSARVRADDSVSDDLKIRLGLKLRAAGLTRSAAPAAFPTLAIIGLKLGSHELIAGSDNEGPSRAKPDGAATLLVVRAIGDAPASDPKGAAFLTLATRTRFRSEFTVHEGGKFATYFARWANARGELGPWSAPVSMRIAA